MLAYKKMSSTNKHGLSRDIPSDIKRQVRQNSKFGCVMCRSAFYQYEHIKPEFKDALKHDPEAICLLCGRCHDKVTKGFLSKETVLKAYIDTKTNNEVSAPFDAFDLSAKNLNIKFGDCVFHLTEKLIVIDNTNILSINPPDNEYLFPTISGFFCDVDGNRLFSIEKNEWSGSIDTWDSEIIGNEITIRLGKGKIALRLRSKPPDTVEIVDLNMMFGKSHILVSKDGLKVGRIEKNKQVYIGIRYLECWGSRIGVLVNSNTMKNPRFNGLRIVGGEGIDLVGTGIRLGVRSGSSYMHGLTLEFADKHKTIISTFPLLTSLEGKTEVLPPRI